MLWRNREIEKQIALIGSIGPGCCQKKHKSNNHSKFIHCAKSTLHFRQAVFQAGFRQVSGSVDFDLIIESYTMDCRLFVT